MSVIIISGREDNFNSLASRKDEGVLSTVEVGLLSGAFSDLFESGGDRWEVRDTVNVPLSLAGSLRKIPQSSLIKSSEQGRKIHTTTRSKVMLTSGLTTLVGTRGRRSASMRAPSVGPEVIGAVGSAMGAPA